ncbi:MAG: 50S ribosomal protein L3 [Candidatus Woesearchaeota archaeon]
MPKPERPRYGSMQFWPRVRAKKETARVRTWSVNSETKPLGFAGYKASMCHIIYTDAKPNSMTNGEDIACPATIIECPPIKVVGIQFYKKTPYGLKTSSQLLSQNLDKRLAKKICLPKKFGKEAENFDDLRLIVHTQPKLTGIGKKTPEIFQIGLGGNKEDKLKFAKEKLGKEIFISEVFKDGQLIDIHGVTKGKGFQGPVKRFGVGLRSHKSEKTKRAPGALGASPGEMHMMYRVAHAGKMGYHLRTNFNQWLMKISNKPEEVKTSGGLQNYGVVKNSYVLIKGSVQGPKKRLVMMTYPIREPKKSYKDAPNIQRLIL